MWKCALKVLSIIMFISIIIIITESTTLGYKGT